MTDRSAGLRLEDERKTIGQLRHAPQKETALGQEHGAFHGASQHVIQSVTEERNRRGDMALGRREAAWQQGPNR